MPFWWFKRGTAVQQVMDTSQNDFQLLNHNLKISFTKVRSDMQALRDWISQMQTNQSFNQQKINQLESRIDEMGEVISYLQTSLRSIREKQKLNEYTSETIPPKQPIHPTSFITAEKPPIPFQPLPKAEPTELKLQEELTETQAVFLLRLAALLKESGQEWIPIKNLASELYPSKDYAAVRSTVSEYLTLLEELGFTKKKRKGKHTFVTLSEQGKKQTEGLKVANSAESTTKKKDKKF